MLHSKLIGFMVASAVAATFCSGARAETLRISGIYPAGDPDVAGIKSITLGSFTGSDGETLAYELQSQLTGIVLNNEQYFEVVEPGFRGADASLGGAVKVTSQFGRVTQTRRVCVAENQKGKCIQYQNRSVSCQREALVFNATVKLTKNSNKQLVYSKTKTENYEIVECPDVGAGETREEAISRMIKTAAQVARYDLAPYFFEERVRLVEEDEGMDKKVAKDFKNAIKQTKKNEDAACNSLRALRASSLEHLSVLYNIALCEEKQGNFTEATTLYRQIQPMFPNKDFVVAGLKRISEKQRAQYEWELRSKPAKKGR